MANNKSSKKRIKVSKRNYLRNRKYKSITKTYIKKINTAIKTGNKKSINKIFNKTKSIIDKLVSKGIFHKNKASRNKSKLSLKIKSFLKT